MDDLLFATESLSTFDSLSQEIAWRIIKKFYICDSLGYGNCDPNFLEDDVAIEEIQKIIKNTIKEML